MPWADVKRMYDLNMLDREAHRLARLINSRPRSSRSPADAFAARIKVGGSVARLIGHDPRLPKTLWATEMASMRWCVRFAASRRMLAQWPRIFWMTRLPNLLFAVKHPNCRSVTICWP